MNSASAAPKRVLIVDDYFASFARYSVGLAVLSSRDCIWQKMTEQLQSAEARDIIDITQYYKGAGGTRDIQLYVLGEPKSEFLIDGVEYAYQHSLQEEAFNVCMANFNPQKAVQTICEFNPDVLLVDMGFLAPADAALVEEYYRMHAKKSCFEIKPDCRTSPIDFPLIHTQEDERRRREGFSRHSAEGYSRYSLQAKGGVILGYLLAKAGIHFSFWTGDLHHGGEGISYAYTFDLLTRDEIVQVIESDNWAYAKFKEYRREAYQRIKPLELSSEELTQVYIRIPIAHDQKGRIIVAGKDIFLRTGDNGKSLFKGEFVGICPGFIPQLEEIVGIAEAYQAK